MKDNGADTSTTILSLPCPLNPVAGNKEFKTIAPITEKVGKRTRISQEDFLEMKAKIERRSEEKKEKVKRLTASFVVIPLKDTGFSIGFVKDGINDDCSDLEERINFMNAIFVLPK
ncbi:hypothetical protein NPIL_14891 [Nephila pilipes]|uniref:Uncharacterized protein n=1 Tax=Nephila pilipes TaxID=299642 RepID=A0A8X6UHT3_NEPPI|nr:hypothetical protein NPIL_14891 [Nephila pilipes]